MREIKIDDTQKTENRPVRRVHVEHPYSRTSTALAFVIPTLRYIDFALVDGTVLGDTFLGKLNISSIAPPRYSKDCSVCFELLPTTLMQKFLQPGGARFV